MQKLLLLFFLLVVSLNFKAQNYHIGGAFPTIDHSGRINNRFEYSIYYFAAINILNPNAYKLSDSYTGALYAENALTYQIIKPLSLTASYVYERQNAFKSYYTNENRFYVQATYKHLLNNILIKQRLRYDGRFIENRLNNKWPYTSRIRYLIGFGKDISNSLYFSTYNEFFFNTYKESPIVYAENWAYAGVGFKFRKNNAIELGPLYIFWVNNVKYQLTNFYYLQFTWVNHLNFSKND